MFEPVQTIADFSSLHEGEILEGYLDGFCGDTPPAYNRTRSYWHGWRNAMIESGRLPADRAYRLLADAFSMRGMEQSGGGGL